MVVIVWVGTWPVIKLASEMVASRRFHFVSEVGSYPSHMVLVLVSVSSAVVEEDLVV